VLLTGEVRFHECLSAQAPGLALLLPGQYGTERLEVEELAGRLMPFVSAAGFHAGRARMLQIVPLIRERIKVLSDVITVGDFSFLDELPPYDPAELVPQKGDTALALAVLRLGCSVLSETDFSHDALESALRNAATELGIKTGQMFQPIRVAVCGRKNAPPLFATLEVLGKEVSLKRIGQAIKRLERSAPGFGHQS